MKSSYKLMLFCCLFSSSIHAQVLWSEDFESYTVGTGYIGATSPTAALESGDYPTLVTKWTVDTAAAQLTASSDWLAVQEDELGNKTFEIRDADGEFIWLSEVVTITGYLDVVLSVSITEVSNLESTDYINVYYKLDGGEEVLFETNGSNSNDFTGSIASQENIIGNSIQIIIRAKNNAGTELIRFDNVLVVEKSVFITEVSNPLDNNAASFIELKNGSNHNIDFDADDYYITVQTDGVSWNEFQLQGSLCGGCIHVIAQSSSDFTTAYDFSSPEVNPIINGNGNDAYFIFYNGNHATGSVVDVYGVLNENGTGQTWSYENSRAIRSATIEVGTPFWMASEWTITLANTNDMTPGALENELRFSNANWCPYSSAPTNSSTDLTVLIQDGVVVINEPIDCSSLSIFDDATLDLNAGIGITVSGNCTNNGTLKIQSNATSNGSLIVNGSTTNTINYNLYATGGTSSPWHLISSPVQSQDINTFVTNSDNSIQTSSNNNYGLAVFNTSTDAWNYFHNGFGSTPSVEAFTAGNFQDAKGYSVLRSSSGMLSFSGGMNTNDQTIALTASKWNLIGNPYPSYINVNNSASVNYNVLSSSTAALNDSYEAVYLWNATSSEYNIINQSSTATYLSPGQAFYVLADADGGDFSFTETMQTHQTGDWFERSLAYPSIKILATANEQTKSTTIKLIENTSFGLDIGYDASLFDGDESSFYIFSQIADGSNENLDLGMQCVFTLNSNEFEGIHIGLVVDGDTEVDFTFELNDWDVSNVTYFKDLLVDSVFSISEQSIYSTVISDEESSTGRFIIFSDAALSEVNIEVDSIEKLQIHVASGFLYVLGADEIVEMKLYDTFGRMLKNEKMKSSSCNLSNLLSGVYIVSVKYKNQIINRKIIL